MTISTRVPSIEGILTDKDRVNALYAPFRPRDANPEHYDRKLKFWMKTVEEYGTSCHRLSFTVKELQNEFRIDGKSPVCLNEVVSQFQRDGTVLCENDFKENLKAAENWTAWSQTSARRVFRKVGAYIPSPISYFYRATEEDVRFINLNQLKMLRESVLSQGQGDLINKLMSVATWKSKIADLTKLCDPLDIEYLLGYLKSAKNLVLDKIGSEEVVLMCSNGTLPTVSVVDKGKYDISRTKQILETQLSDITAKAQQAEERARVSLKQGRRNTAKHELRRKKLLEQRMEKLLTMVDNLAVLEMKIDDAKSDAVMISAYEAGKKALTEVLEDKRLNVDRVTEAMLDIQELLDQHADVSAALSQPMDGQDADIEALEEELESLLKEDDQKTDIKLPPKKEPEPVKFSADTDVDEDEAMKMLEALELDDLEDFSKTMSTGKHDKNGDVC